MSDSIVSILLNLVSALATGLVILVLEYRTKWFANHTPLNFFSKPKTKPTNWIEVKKDRIEHIFEFFIFLLFLSLIVFLFSFFYFILSTFLVTFSGGTNTTLDNPSDPYTVVKTIDAGETSSFFNNGLYISVVEVTYFEEVTFTVGSPFAESITVERAQNGYSLIYDSGAFYQIRLTSVFYNVTVERADFSVTQVILTTPTPFLAPPTPVP